MKKNDLYLLIFIVAFTVLIAYFIGKAVIGEPKNKPVQIDKAVAISESFPAPDTRVFNDKSYDPTVNITIGGQQSNNDPFSNSNSNQGQ